MLLFLIRHGESTQNNGENYEHRLPDHTVPLSATGHIQADEAGVFLRNFIDTGLGIVRPRIRLWCSPYMRTRQTADHIEEHIKDLIVDRREHVNLVERQWGLYDGLTDEEMKTLYPRESEHYYRCREHQGTFWAHPPLGESSFDVALRVHQMFGTLHRDYDKSCIWTNVIVTHGTTMRAFVMQWLHKDPEWLSGNQIHQIVPYGSLTKIPTTDTSSLHKRM